MDVTSLSLEELQAKFRAVQAQEVSNRLSERNCVEIIMKLIDTEMLQVIFTQSGKEYLTPKQLELEIKDEVLQHRGRVNIVELQPILNVDLSHIERKAEEIVRHNRQFQIVDGELIASYYLDGVAEEINESLRESGEARIPNLASRFNLSSEYLEVIIQRYLGRTIKGVLERGILYTDAYIERHTARMKGVLSAVTKPVTLTNIITTYNFQETLFYSTLDELINQGKLNGKKERGTYIPAIFSTARENRITSFFAQNGYIDYQSMEKLQYGDMRNFLKFRYPDGIPLSSCFVGPAIIRQIDGICEEAVLSDTWVDVSQSAPSMLSTDDLAVLLNSCQSIQPKGKTIVAVVLCDYYVASKGFLDRCMKLYEQSIKEKAEKGLLKRVEMPSVEEEPEEKSKKGKGRAAAKGGRKQELKGKQEKEDPLKEVLVDLKKWFEDAPEEFLEALAVHLREPMAKIRDEATRNAFVDQAKTKQKNETFKDNFTTLFNNIQLFQKGIETLKEDEVGLEKHLLKTLCTELTNLLLNNQALYHCINISKPISTPADRTAILNQFPPQVGKPLQKLVASLNGKTSKEFLAELDAVADVCQLHLKPLDKKLEKQLLLTHRQTLMDQLVSEENPATVFHLVLVILYLKKMGVMVHAAGRSLTVILSKLKAEVGPEAFGLLSNYQTEVVKFLTSGKQEAVTSGPLKDNMGAVKALVLGADKPE